MLYAVLFLGALCVVEAVERSHEITRDTSDALERNVREMVLGVHKAAVNLDIDAAKVLFGILCAGALYIVVDFLLRELSPGNVYVDHNFSPSVFLPLSGRNIIVSQYIVQVNCDFAQYFDKNFVRRQYYAKNFFVRFLFESCVYK